MLFSFEFSNLDCTVGHIPILLYISHLDGYILVLQSLLDKIIEWWGSFLILWNIFLILSPSSRNLLIGRCAKTVHILHVSRTCSFSLYSTVSPIFCSCIHRQWLKWKLQPVKTESGKTIYCTDDRCFQIVLHNFWWPERTPILRQS